MTDTPYNFFTAPGFERVADRFKANFDAGLEHGAAFYVMRNGTPIVDLKGGWADRQKTKPLSDDHLVAVFSSGKAVVSLLIALLAQDDRLGYNQPVKSIWPGFKGDGKDTLSVAQLMSHQAGLSGVTNENWTAHDWFDWDKTCRQLASQTPLFEPGSASGYSPVTFGFLAGEIARLSDEFGRHLGQILREEICDAHDLDVWLGLPESEHHRCADMLKPRAMADLGDITPTKKAAFLEPWSSPGRKGLKQWREAQLSGSNCHANAKGLAKIMQMAVDGTVCQERFLAEDIVTMLHTPQISGPDKVLPFDITFTPGLMKNTPNKFYGPNPNTVGHSGWGGSCVFADPDAGVSAAYVMTRQDNSLIGDPRPTRLIEALYTCL